MEVVGHIYLTRSLSLEKQRRFPLIGGYMDRPAQV